MEERCKICYAKICSGHEGESDIEKIIEHYNDIGFKTSNKIHRELISDAIEKYIKENYVPMKKNLTIEEVRKINGSITVEQWDELMNN